MYMNNSLSVESRNQPADFFAWQERNRRIAEGATSKLEGLFQRNRLLQKAGLEGLPEIFPRIKEQVNALLENGNGYNYELIAKLVVEITEEVETLFH